MACQTGDKCRGGSYKEGSCNAVCTSGCSVCSTSCGDTCKGSCQGCTGTCKSGCAYTCSGSCDGGCRGGCSSSCSGSCSGSCDGSCSSSCDVGCTNEAFTNAYNNLVLSDIIKKDEINTISDWVKNEGVRRGIAMASPEVSISNPVFVQTFNAIEANLTQLGQTVDNASINSAIRKASIQQYIDKAKILYSAAVPHY